MRGFQLWLNLPARDKMTAPKYQEFAAERIPVASPSAGVRVKVIAGAVQGVHGPISQPATEPTYLDVELAADARFSHELPPEHAAFLFVFEGAVRVGTDRAARIVHTHELAVLGNGTRVTLVGASAAAPPARAILVAGRPLREPVAKYGPFVMNTREELIRAFEDYQSGRF